MRVTKTTSVLIAVSMMVALVTTGPAFSDDLLPRQFLTKYCIGCHGPKQQKADRRFDTLKLDYADANTGELHQDILDQLNLGTMPPEDAPRPSDAELKAAVTWWTASLLQAREAARRDTGKVILRRMNRSEYRNTIRDLFQLDMTDFDPTLSFPDDGVVDGFRNIGSGLTMSDFFLRKAMKAAEVIADRVIRPGARPESETIRNAAKASGSQPREIGSNYLARLLIARDTVPIRQGTRRNWTAPEDGHYTLRITAVMLRRLQTRFTNADLHYRHWNEPARLRVTTSSSHVDVPFKRIVGEYDVPDDSPKTIVIRMLLRRGALVTLNWANGLDDSVKRIRRKVLPKYTQDAIYPARNPLEMYVGAGPELRIRELEIDGPSYEEWPPAGIAMYFHDVPKQPTEADLKRCLDRLATRAFRRPVSPTANLAYQRVARAHFKKQGSFWAAAKLGMRTILCSPQFLYLVETAPANDAGRLDSYELASRLSYFLWNTMPDDKLFAAAKDGTLLKSEVLLTQVDRMLKDKKSGAFVKNFLGQWLWLDQLGEMPPDPTRDAIYYQLKLEQAMAEETRRCFTDLLQSNGSILELIDSRQTWLNEGLARIYEIDGVKGNHFRKVTLPIGSRRGGLLGQASVLTVTSNGVETQPVRRGVWILENILGTPTPPPPPDVPEIAPDTRSGNTIRSVMELHRANRTCYECHKKIDPLGLSLEKFDYLGRFRADYGQDVRKRLGAKAAEIDVSGKLPDGTTITGIDGLKQSLLKHPDMFARCLTKKLMTYGLGRRLAFTDRDDIDRIVGEMKRNQYGLRDLIKQVVLS
jgi:hypothetical protein